MHQPRNGMAAADLRDVTWRKSRHSNSQGACVELGLGDHHAGARAPPGQGLRLDGHALRTSSGHAATAWSVFVCAQRTNGL